MASGWGYGQALLGAVTEGVKDLVQPDFEDEDEMTEGSRADSGVPGEERGVTVAAATYARLQRDAQEVHELRQQTLTQNDLLSALQTQNRSLQESLQSQTEGAAEGGVGADAGARGETEEALRTQLASLTGQLSALSDAQLQEKEAGAEALREASALSAEQETQLTSLRAEVTSLTEQLSTTAASHAQENEAGALALREAAARNTEQEAQLTSLRAEVGSLEEQLSTTAAASNSADETAKLDASLAKVTQLEAELAALRVAEVGLKESLAAAQAQSQTQAQTPPTKPPPSQEDLQRLKDEAKEAHRLRLLVTQLQASSCETDDLREEISELEAAAAAAKEKSTAEASSLRAQVERLEAAAAATPPPPALSPQETQELLMLREEVATLHRTLAAAQTRLEEELAHSDELGNRVNSLKSDAEAAEALRGTVVHLQSSVQERSRENDTLHKQVSDLEEHISRSVESAHLSPPENAGELQALRDTVSAAEASLCAEQSRCEALSTRLADEEAASAVLRAANERLSAERDTAVSEAHAASTKVSTLETEHSTSTARLQTELHDLQTHRTSTHSDLATLQGEVLRLEAEVKLVGLGLVESDARVVCVAEEAKEAAVLWLAAGGVPSPVVPADTTAVNAVQEKMRSKDEEISSLNTLVLELQRSSEMHQANEDAAGVLEQKLSEAQETIQKYQSEQLSLGTTIAVKDSEVQPLKDKIAQLEQDRVTEKQGYQDSIQKYHEWHKNSQKTLDETAAISEKRRVELESAFVEVRQYHSRIQELTTDIKQSEDDAQKVRQALSNAQDENNRLKDDVDALHQDLDLLQHTEDNRKSHNDNSSQIINTLSIQLKELNAQLEAERIRNYELGSREDDDARERDILLDRVSAAESNAASVEAQTYSRIEELQQRLVVKDEEVKALAVRLSGVHSDEEARQAEVTESLQKVDNLQSVLDHFVAERDKDIRAATRTSAAELEAATARFAALEARLATKDTETEDVRRASHKEIAKSNSMVTTLQGKLAQMRRLLDETLSKCNEEVVIEKKFVTKLILQYIGKLKARQDLREILTIMGGVLGWSEAEKIAAGALKEKEEPNASWWNMLTPSKREVPEGDAPAPSLSDMWVNFLLQESDGRRDSTQSLMDADTTLGMVGPEVPRIAEVESAEQILGNVLDPMHDGRGGGGGGGGGGANMTPLPTPATPVPILDFSQDTIAHSPPASPLLATPQADE